MDENHLNLLYGATSSYCAQTATSMYSVLRKNSWAARIDVYVLCEGVPASAREKLQQTVRDFPNAHVHFLFAETVLKPLREKFSLRAWNGSYNQYIYACLCDAFPELSRILWLDGDVVCVGSLEALWKWDLTGCCVAAGLDCTPFLCVGPDEAFFATPFYFNAGVLLFNLENCRTYGLQERCQKVLQRRGRKLRYCDQTMLNLAIPPSRVAHLPLRYNWPAGISDTALRSVAWCNREDKPTFSREAFFEERAQVRLLHFIGGPLPTKPWYPQCTSPWKAYYLQNRVHTPWGEDPLPDGRPKNAWEAFVRGFSYLWDTRLSAIPAFFYRRLHGKRKNPFVEK